MPGVMDDAIEVILLCDDRANGRTENHQINSSGCVFAVGVMQVFPSERRVHSATVYETVYDKCQLQVVDFAAEVWCLDFLGTNDQSVMEMAISN
jgi:hypothetical protein